MSSSSDVEHHYNHKSTGLLTPQRPWKMRRCSRDVPSSERKPRTSNDRFHAIHKVPLGDSPYVRAKQVQLIDKDPNKAVSLFWSAINSGDRVESALKDMAGAMQQLDRPDEAIEAIKSFRHLCPPQSQESIDNLLLDLYKVAGKFEEEIEMLLLKVNQVEEGFLFGGTRTKTARFQGHKVHITIEKEYSRLLGKLAWAYMKQQDFKSAEEYFRKSLSIESDKNKQCNLALCLVHQNKLIEAKFLLQAIRPSGEGHIDESYAKSYERASQTLADMESQRFLNYAKLAEFNSGCSRQQNLDGFQTPPVPRFLNRTNGKLCTDFPCEKEAGFGRKIDCRSYGTPCSNRETPRASFRKPGQCLWSFNGRDQRNSEEHFRQPLPFRLSTQGENGQSLMNRNPCNYSAFPKVQLPSPYRDWGENLVDNLEKVKKAPEPFERNENQNNLCSFVYGGDAKTAPECDLAADSSSTADSTITNIISNMEPVESHSFSSIKPLDTETIKTCDLQTGCGIMSEYFTLGRKKSRADLVEGDEQEPENWRKQFSVEFSENGDCNDEAVDFKIISETHQVQKSSQELGSLDLDADGYFTQSEKVDEEVERSLCCNQRKYQKHCTFPLKAKAFRLRRPLIWRYRKISV